MSELEPVLRQADANLESSLQTLFDLVRIPSISTDPAHAADCRRAAQALSDYLTELGFDASVRDTTGHPMVVAHHAGPDDESPHYLFYGHYDVQPVDPLHLWDHPPFEPAIRIGAKGQKIISGRGTCDDKAQLLTFVEAVRAYKEVNGKLPARISIIFEGEEECGSPSARPFLEANKDELKADYVLVCDTGMWDDETPSICAGLRGLVGEEIKIYAASHDLHSGGFGAIAANPLHIIGKIVAGLHDETGRITLPGFYDGVHETPPELKKVWDALEASRPHMLEQVGLSIPVGEKGRSMLELNWARPTAEVNGISGGYAGEGFKTVIPAEATAKISFRLVHDQDPHKIRAIFRDYVRSKVPADCRVEFGDHGAAPAVQLPYDAPILDKAKQALKGEWDNPAIVTGGGGSIPIVGDFRSILGMDALLVGWGTADDRGHAPNEKYNLSSFEKGIRGWIRILDAISKP
ncbi:M20/M25/M40 family metallo-hydrolase [Devosia sp. MC532]|uniref:M20/M25/M40 family metallo-hydrolase n=1 Tax=Devosia sp. MC532 TaxID=2799788 RepID=UPI0018F3227C|nr:M20/M25/M40 family metallo-hydrolase [Devosia sp. MC532]MBJ7576554.1 M20/M25/M40 family metallo-hydrolase [Devosia sp. MC532]